MPPRANGMCAICLNFHAGRNTYQISLGKSVEPDHWDKAKARVNRKHHMSHSINAFIEREKNRLDQIILDLKHQGKPLDPEKIKQLFKGNDGQSVHEFIDNELRLEGSGTVKFGTWRKKRAKMRILKEYAPSLNFQQITSEFLAHYHDWLMYEKDNCRNTANDNIKTLKSYLTKARRKGVIAIVPEFPLTREESEFDYLEPNEVAKLEELYCSGELATHLLNVLHVFLIALYTGVRWSDYTAFNLWDGKSDTIRFKQKKTGGASIIYLSERVKELLKGNYHLISYDKTLCYLKEVARIAGIEKRIGTHTARHTLAITLLTQGKTVKFVSQVLSHKNTRITETHYARFIPDETMQKIMKDFKY